MLSSMATTTEPTVGEPSGGGRRAGDAPAESASPGTPGPTTAPRVLFGELTSSVSGVLLLVFLFATEWYGVAGVPDPSAARPAVSGAESGWTGLSVVRWVVLVTALVAIGSVVLHASQRRHGTKTDTSRLVAGLGSVTSLLLIYRVLIHLPSGEKVIDQKLGAVLALVCALGVALGGYESIAEHQARARTVVQRPRRRVRRRASGSEPIA
jgi:hypothetical protein